MAAIKVERLQLTQSRITGIDGLRGLAVLLIVFFHYVTTAIDPSSNEYAKTLFKLSFYFNSGVDLFFIISGFLITRKLCSSILTLDSLKSYLWGRARRILPLYYLGLLVCGWIFYLGMGADTVWYYSEEVPWYSYIIFLQNEWMGWTGSMGSRLMSIYWSLGIEVQFYLIAPIIMFIMKPRMRIIFLSLAIISSIFFRIYDGTLIGSYTHFFCRMDSLFAGAFIAILSVNGNWMKSILSKVRIWEIMVLIFLFITIALSFNYFIIPGYLISTFFILLYSGLLLLQLTEKGSFFDFSNNGFFRFFGRYSYGIYVWHEIIRFSVFQIFTSDLPRFSCYYSCFLTLISALLTLIVAVVFYHLLEVKWLSNHN